MILDEKESPAASTAADRIALGQVAEVLRTIHPRKRRMLLLHAAGFTCEEIAAEYGISVERARALVYKARLQVRERTDAEGCLPDTGGRGIWPALLLTQS